MNGWERLKTWRTIGCVADVPHAPGVYAVRAMRCGKPKVIQRVFGGDKSGILCFGTTKNRTLRKRLGQFYQAASGRAIPHAEGKTYHRLGRDRNGYPLVSIEIAWLELPTQGQARERERAWFHAYEDMFGELPPLNKQCG